MSKFIKRIGTKAHKFHVDIYLKKFEISMLGNQESKCLIIFKRGDHTLKCKNPVVLKNKEAVFTEVLSHISTLYYNKKKKKYLTKPAQLDIILIFQDNQQKAAGTVFIDLSSYPNSSKKKATETLQVEKCPDKNAKITFEIKIRKIGEVEDLENDKSFIQSNETFKKTKNTQKPSQKPKPPSKEIQSKPKEESKETSQNQKKPLNSDIKKPINSSSQNTSKQSKPKEKSSSSEDSKENSDESSSENSSESEESVSGNSSNSGSGSKSSSSSKKNSKNSLKQMKLGIENSLRRSKSNTKQEKKPEKPVIDNELNLSNIKSVKTINSDDHLSQKIKNLLKDSNSGSKDSAKIDNIPTITKKNEEKQKKITMPPSFAQNKAQDSDEDQMFMEFSAQKIKQLEQKFGAKNKENQENLRRIQELESENSSIKEEIARMKAELEESLNLNRKSSIRPSIGTPTFEAKIVEKESELKALKLENLELKNMVKMKDLEIKEKTMNFTKNSSIELQEMKFLLDSKEKDLKELEIDKNQALELIETLKASNSSNNASKSNKIEDFYKKKVETLNEEVYSLKKQLEESTSNEELSRLELENELSRVKIENQSLVKQVKETQNINKSTALSLKSLSKNNILNETGISNGEICELKENLAVYKENYKALEGEKVGFEERIKEKDRKMKELEERIGILEGEIQRTKQKLAEILNAAFENGATEFVEMIENTLIDQKE